MAGDWIKFEVITSDKPEVFIIAEQLDIDPDAVVGKLLRVWAWFDAHSTQGNAPSVTKTLLDRITGVTNFCKALIDAGWMLDSGGILTITNFTRHNGKTSKNRALARNRQQSFRKNAEENPFESNASVTQGSSLEKRERREELSLSKGLIQNFKPSDVTLEYLKLHNQKNPTESDLVAFTSHYDKKHFNDEREVQGVFRKWMARETGFDNTKNPAKNEQTKLITPWHETVRGIERKGKELGLAQKEDENFQYFKRRVFKKAGHSETAQF